MTSTSSRDVPAAERIKDAFNKAFYKGDGLYGEGRLTELAACVFFD
jgi:hypothetical protein